MNSWYHPYRAEASPFRCNARPTSRALLPLLLDEAEAGRGEKSGLASPNRSAFEPPGAECDAPGRRGWWVWGCRVYMLVVNTERLRIGDCVDATLNHACERTTQVSPGCMADIHSRPVAFVVFLLILFRFGQPTAEARFPAQNARCKRMACSGPGRLVEHLRHQTADDSIYKKGTQEPFFCWMLLAHFRAERQPHRVRSPRRRFARDRLPGLADLLLLQRRPPRLCPPPRRRLHETAPRAGEALRRHRLRTRGRPKWP
ncbi:hypothetical protein BC834DRAFT_608888 [Gloeopeniophorella convolvens]|nr:hypothetical protein BC834DRAFT_608888 [Gloeopeniophorella convolvens]